MVYSVLHSWLVLTDHEGVKTATRVKPVDHAPLSSNIYIYIATGCDYTSFFIGLGKVTFLATFYQHAAFITGRNGPPGSMGQMSLHVESDARFSFLRLIGCSYYKQHVSAFHLKTHKLLYFSISNATSTYDHHAKWLAIIRTTVYTSTGGHGIKGYAFHGGFTFTLEEVPLGHRNVAPGNKTRN